MKNTKITIAIAIITGFVLTTANSMAQGKKYADGSIVYSDGTKKLPNGTVVYRGTKTIKNTNGTFILPDGSVINQDGSRKYSFKKSHSTVYQKKQYRVRRNSHPQSLPPGQAKKIYGGSAKDYAPGQQKEITTRKNENYRHGSHEVNNI